MTTVAAARQTISNIPGTVPASMLTRRDPRLYQIVCLAGLLAYGVICLRFDVTAASIAAIVGAASLAQWLCSRAVGLPVVDLRSALISSLSLCLLLRSNEEWVLCVAAAIAVASKFAIRLRGKHIFNPTNFAIVVSLLLFSDSAWVSPSQWGSGAYFAFLMACVGGLVINRARRSDVTIAFLIAYMLLLFGRALWLGDPMSIPVRQLQSGALLLFAFFMISDPKTTPDSRTGRIVFAVLVALGAGIVQFVLYRTNGLLWSLVVCAPGVPIIDRLFPGPRYQWHSKQGEMI